MSRDTVKSAAALIIGNELLSGKIRDENLDQLARTLRSLGIALSRAVFVEDDLATIAREVSELSQSYDVVFTSGGVGPTHDDVTIDAVASAFGARVVTDEHFAGLIRQAYGARCTEAHLRMARVPEGAELVSSREITWPTVLMRNVWVMPGVPEIFRMKLSIVRERLRGPIRFVSHVVYTQIEESDLKPLLDQVVQQHPNVQVGSYPKWLDPSYRTKVTIDATDPAAVKAALGSLLSLLPPGEPQRTESGSPGDEA